MVPFSFELTFYLQYNKLYQMKFTEHEMYLLKKYKPDFIWDEHDRRFCTQSYNHNKNMYFWIDHPEWDDGETLENITQYIERHNYTYDSISISIALKTCQFEEDLSRIKNS